MLIFWIAIATVAGIGLISVLGVAILCLSYMNAEEWKLEQLERRHGLRED